jgi:hypothetical protein
MKPLSTWLRAHRGPRDFDQEGLDWLHRLCRSAPRREEHPEQRLHSLKRTFEAVSRSHGLAPALAARSKNAPLPNRAIG